MRANALIVMGKAPVAGRVKTRLRGFLSAEDAAELSRCLLVDQLVHLCELAVADLYLAFAPDDAEAVMRQLAPADFRLFSQQAGDLGERMAAAFEGLFVAGYKNIALIGSDLAPLPLRILEEAFTLLETTRPRAVLGPARDGGYYLIGLNQPIPDIFRDMIWSHDRVLAETRAKLAALEIDHRLLPAWFDIDTPDDLRYFESALDAGLKEKARNTLIFLRRLKLNQL